MPVKPDTETTDPATGKPFPSNRARMLHRNMGSVDLSEAEYHLIAAFQQIRRAEADPEEYDRHEAWLMLRQMVAKVMRGGAPSRPDLEEDPDLYAAAVVVARWIAGYRAPEGQRD